MVGDSLLFKKDGEPESFTVVETVSKAFEQLVDTDRLKPTSAKLFLRKLLGADLKEWIMKSLGDFLHFAKAKPVFALGWALFGFLFTQFGAVLFGSVNLNLSRRQKTMEAKSQLIDTLSFDFEEFIRYDQKLRRLALRQDKREKRYEKRVQKSLHANGLAKNPLKSYPRELTSHSKSCCSSASPSLPSPAVTHGALSAPFYYQHKQRYQKRRAHFSDRLVMDFIRASDYFPSVRPTVGAYREWREYRQRPVIPQATMQQQESWRHRIVTQLRRANENASPLLWLENKFFRVLGD